MIPGLGIAVDPHRFSTPVHMILCAFGVGFARDSGKQFDLGHELLRLQESDYPNGMRIDTWNRYCS